MERIWKVKKMKKTVTFHHKQQMPALQLLF